MDRNEARLILQAYRPNGEDAKSPHFAEALAQVERDPELKAWWEAQQAFDRKFAAKLQQVEIPRDLRANILASRKVVAFPARTSQPYWLAIAALLIILCVAGGIVHQRSTQTIASTSYHHDALAFLGNDDPSLGMMSADHDKITAWLKQQNAPVGSLPSAMTSLPSVGCQTYAMHGHSVSLICFSLADGRIAHLFMIEKQALTDPPGTSPEYQKDGPWSLAMWSDQSHSYLLATQDSPDALKQLL